MAHAPGEAAATPSRYPHQEGIPREAGFGSFGRLNVGFSQTPSIDLHFSVIVHPSFGLLESVRARESEGIMVVKVVATLESGIVGACDKWSG